MQKIDSKKRSPYRTPPLPADQKPEPLKWRQPVFGAFRWAIIFLVAGCLCACGQNKALENIFENEKLVVLTRNNAHCYYTYRDQEMGFEFELSKAFADFLGVKLEIKVADSWVQMLPLLEEDIVHIVAASVTITPSRQRMVDFSNGYLPVQQMVIVHKKNKDLKTLDDLSGKTVYIRSGTSYEERLRALKRSGIDITIEAIDNIPTQELISDVAEKKIDVTIADSNVALLNRRYYPDIRIAFPIEKPQALGWAVKKGEHLLRKKIDGFFHTIEQNGTFQQIYNRHYAYVERFDHLDIKKFQQRMKTRLPKYEKTIRKAAAENGFDWRLIAALIYQESQFRPWAKSFSGVRGLMQLTLPTAREMGVKNRLDPYKSIEGGTKYLKKYMTLFPIPRSRTESSWPLRRTMSAKGTYEMLKKSRFLWTWIQINGRRLKKPFPCYASANTIRKANMATAGAQSPYFRFDGF